MVLELSVEMEADNPTGNALVVRMPARAMRGRVREIEAKGIHPVKIEVDVEEMLTWCSAQGLSVTPETRTKFMMTRLRELVKNGTVKP